jgi:hypothetical protein
VRERKSEPPIKAAGDLSEVANASLDKTTEELARDLEAVASKQGGANRERVAR